MSSRYAEPLFSWRTYQWPLKVLYHLLCPRQAMYCIDIIWLLTFLSNGNDISRAVTPCRYHTVSVQHCIKAQAISRQYTFILHILKMYNKSITRWYRLCFDFLATVINMYIIGSFLAANRETRNILRSKQNAHHLYLYIYNRVPS